jgi:hypothetical protein
MTREAVSLGWTFLTSSSWNEPEVAVHRAAAYEAWRHEGPRRFAGSPRCICRAPPGEEARSPFMTRDTSATRSITTIRVEPDRAEAKLVWWPRHAASKIDPSVPEPKSASRWLAPSAAVGEAPPH